MRWSIVSCLICYAFCAHAQVPYEVLLFGDPARNNRGSASVVLNDTVWFAGTISDGMDGSDDIRLHCIAPDGHIIWSKTFGDGRNEYVNNMIRCSDGNLYIVGDVRNTFTEDLNGFIVAVDTAGTLLWSTDDGDPDLEEDYYNIDCLSDTGLAVTGFITDTAYSGNDILLAKYALTGAWVSKLVFGDTLNDYGMSISCLPGGNIIISGDRADVSGTYHAFYAKVLPDNTIAFDVPVTDTYNSGCKNMHLHSDGTLYLCGESASALDPQFDVLFARMDTLGNVLALNTIPYPGAEAGYDITSLPGNRYGITGFGFNPFTVENDLLFTIVNAEGEELIRNFYGLSGADLGYDIQSDAEGNVWMSGFIADEDTVWFALVHTGTGTDIHAVATPEHSVQLFPNPVQDRFRISGTAPIMGVSLIDAYGRYILPGLNNDDGYFCLPKGITPGMYIIAITLPDRVVWKKIIAG